MSGFVSNIYFSASVFTPKTSVEMQDSCIEYIDTGYTVPLGEEAAGKVGKILGIVAAVVMPFAAPAIFGAVAASGVLGSGLAAAATAGTIGTMTSVLGSAVVGGIMNAGIAYASGARGGDVWRAAGIGALSGGLGGMSHAAGAAKAVAGASSGGTPAVGAIEGVKAAASTVGAAPAATVASGLVQAPASVGATTASGTIMNGVRQIFGNVSGQTMQRISAALINAAVNGQSMGQLDGLVAQQRAELEALRQSDAAAYQQRINVAQQILADADRMDPSWMARIRMADVAGMEANQFQQAMRNIAVRQGGSLDAGQRKAYERGSALHTARSKALAYGQAYNEAQLGQNQLRAQGAQFLGPNDAGFRTWQADTELRAAQERAHREASNSTWGGIAAGLFERDYPAATSPDPSANQNENTNSFLGGLRNPFGGS